MLSRRRFLVAGAYSAIGSAFGYSRYIEPFALEVTHVPLRFVNGPASSSVTWVQLSDFHAFDAMPFWTISDAISLALYQKPDFVCITGDFVTSTIGDHEMYVTALRRLTARIPTFAVTGNHDGGAWSALNAGYQTSEPVRELLLDSGVVVLHNQMETVSVRNAKVQLVGVGDTWAKECDPQKAFRHVTNNAPTVLLSHNPDSKEILGGYAWDLMLSGHTHGGQAQMPLTHATPFAPVSDHRYVSGLNSWRDRLIYTNRGIGSTRGMRINCRPEITVFTLTQSV